MTVPQSHDVSLKLFFKVDRQTGFTIGLAAFACVEHRPQ